VPLKRKFPRFSLVKKLLADGLRPPNFRLPPAIAPATATPGRSGIRRMDINRGKGFPMPLRGHGEG
jgi:hypothetical protein